jgi:hypothetical protein
MLSKKGFITLVISIIITALLIFPVVNSASINFNKYQVLKDKETTYHRGDGKSTDYWALLVAVGVYYNNPDQDRPSMLEAVDKLYSSLLSSPNWQADHIHVLKAGQATMFNLVKELIWLIRSEKKGDMVLLYITTHGTGLRTPDNLPMDLPPKDEGDGDDEALVMYYGFEKWYDYITDDMLKFFLRFIQSDGLCMIIDSCFSGGFNDPIANDESKEIEMSKEEEFTKGFLDDISANGRIVLMSCQEEEYSYGSLFSDLIIEGFNGWADLFGNNDGINSAEEAFDFAYPWVVLFSEGKQHPTELDEYSGDFPVTYT